MKVSAIIVAAGKGLRMGGDKPKQFLELNGRPIICYTLDKFAQFTDWDISIAVEPDRVESFKEEIVERYDYPKSWRIVAGGEKRQDTVKNALDLLPNETEIVLIHDGVRPFITTEMIETSIECAKMNDACLIASKVIPTIKEVDENGEVVRTIDRQRLWEAQTPQTFKKSLLLQAMQSACDDNFYGTDEASLFERIGKKVFIIEGNATNIKITRPEDLHLACSILEMEVG
ncbi:MAG: 2-C-methyl-D-erythritol 4-phosphate cytidylyltransferase [Pseudomonadota bacterium]